MSILKLFTRGEKLRYLPFMTHVLVSLLLLNLSLSVLILLFIVIMIITIVIISLIITHYS